MSCPMPEAVCVPDDTRRLSQRRTGLPNARASPWCVLRGLLLGPNGSVARGRRNEPALDCCTYATNSLGKGHSVRPTDRFSCWHGPRRHRRVAFLDCTVMRAVALLFACPI